GSVMAGSVDMGSVNVGSVGAGLEPAPTEESRFGADCPWHVVWRAVAMMLHAKRRDTRMTSGQGNQFSKLMALEMLVSLLVSIPAGREQGILSLVPGMRLCASGMVG
ncbi:hypothetical protein, partial [Chloroflexus sp.]|uniref:hypothetical protein n=1 Tax=Chloroflexus sp. TaxID=1904827 RepID=UPI004049082F